jgi:hypothetical protein
MPASACDIIDHAWELVRTPGPVDAERLFAAVADPAVLRSEEARTRLLAADAFLALGAFWGERRFRSRIIETQIEHDVDRLLTSRGDDDGFLTLRDRVMNSTRPDTVLQLLRELGSHINTPTSMIVGGSIALMLESLIVRHTDDLDIVDEIPKTLRDEHDPMASLATRYGLKLTHFQSHDLPNGWEARTRSLGQFGALSVRVVDTLDVLVGKLFSKREKDLDDVRLAWPKVDQIAYRSRLARSTAAFRATASLEAVAQKNWYILTGESALP